MRMRKGELMRNHFGESIGTCKGCCHLLYGGNRSKRYYKCEIYGNTHSEATDWKISEQACGMKNLPYKGDRPIVSLVTPEKGEPEIEGQVSLF